MINTMEPIYQHAYLLVPYMWYLYR